MSQIYNDNTKRPKLQDIRLRILKIYAIYQKIQQRISGQERALLELRGTCLWEYDQKPG